MNLQLILQMVTAMANVGEKIVALLEDSKEVMNSSDKLAIKQQLARLQVANDAIHERVQAKLEAAERR